MINKTTRYALLFLFALLSLSQPSWANAADIITSPQNSKCLPAAIYEKKVDFFSLHANFSYLDQALVVKKTQIGTHIGGYACQYSIGLYGYSHNSGWLPLWATYLQGSGELFYDGVWHQQRYEFLIALDEIKILPTRYQQLLIYYKYKDLDGYHSYIGIYYFYNQSAFSENLIFSFADHGSLEYIVKNNEITISGCWDTCARTGSVTLRYESDVHQYAIVNPNRNSEQFYKYIRREVFNPTEPWASG
ncbi:MAG: hypothetical protein WBR15_08590 [Gammaproteobacteria bacterium]